MVHSCKHNNNSGNGSNNNNTNNTNSTNNTSTRHNRNNGENKYSSNNNSNNNNNNDSYNRIRIGTIRKMKITVITSIEEKSVSGHASRKLNNKPSSMFGVSVFVISGTQAIEPHGL